jgi:hypothetical protein
VKSYLFLFAIFIFTINLKAEVLPLATIHVDGIAIPLKLTFFIDVVNGEITSAGVKNLIISKSITKEEILDNKYMPFDQFSIIPYTKTYSFIPSQQLYFSIEYQVPTKETAFLLFRIVKRNNRFVLEFVKYADEIKEVQTIYISIDSSGQYLENYQIY